MRGKRKDYSPLKVFELGQLTRLTQGSAGTKTDYDLISGKLVIDPNPTCQTNGPPACLNLPS